MNNLNNTVLSPIVLFVYNRLWHTEQTLEALSKNNLADESILYIYADGPKPDAADDQLDKIKQVRELIKSRQWCKEIHIIESEANKGLANSIISGVTEVINKHGKIIVMEDDIVTSPYFLKFMNKALNYYENESKVWHITGWNYLFYPDGKDDAFFWKTMNCWGWGTWKDRWQYYEKNTDKLISELTQEDIFKLDVFGSTGMWDQVLSNKNGNINSWAIYWYVTIYKNNGLCLNPTESYVKNIGFDGTGVHCGANTNYNYVTLCEKDINFDLIEIKENKLSVREIINLYKHENLEYNISQLNYRIINLENNYNSLNEKYNLLYAYIINQITQIHNEIDYKTSLKYFIKKIFYVFKKYLK
jgi:hypothetical protein